MQASTSTPPPTGTIPPRRCPHDDQPCERARRCSLTLSESCANLHHKLTRNVSPDPCQRCRAKRAGYCPGFHCLVAWRRLPSGTIWRDESLFPDIY